MWEELGISAGTAIIVLIALYFVIKWAVKSGMEEVNDNLKKILKEMQNLSKENISTAEKNEK